MLCFTSFLSLLCVLPSFPLSSILFCPFCLRCPINPSHLDLLSCRACSCCSHPTKDTHTHTIILCFSDYKMTCSSVSSSQISSVLQIARPSVCASSVFERTGCSLKYSQRGHFVQAVVCERLCAWEVDHFKVQFGDEYYDFPFSNSFCRIERVKKRVPGSLRAFSECLKTYQRSVKMCQGSLKVFQGTIGIFQRMTSSFHRSLRRMLRMLYETFQCFNFRRTLSWRQKTWKGQWKCCRSSWWFSKGAVDLRLHKS